MSILRAKLFFILLVITITKSQVFVEESKWQSIYTGEKNSDVGIAYVVEYMPESHQLRYRITSQGQKKNTKRGVRYEWQKTTSKNWIIHHPLLKSYTHPNFHDLATPYTSFSQAILTQLESFDSEVWLNYQSHHWETLGLLIKNTNFYVNHYCGPILGLKNNIESIKFIASDIYQNHQISNNCSSLFETYDRTYALVLKIQEALPNTAPQAISSTWNELVAEIKKMQAILENR